MLIFSREKLLEAWNEIYRNKPEKKRKSSRGIDGISLERFKQQESEFLDVIYRQLQGDIFQFTRLKRFQLRKGKKIRDIQAPIIADRIVQRVIAKYLLNELKNPFDSAGVVGSVKGNSVKKIVRLSYNFYKEGFVWILKTDIKSYFPSIDKERLCRIVKRRIHDERARTYIEKYLAVSKEAGIPQGTPLSPLMANIYLLDFDQLLSKRADIRHFRYIDDVLVFCKTKEEAVRICKTIGSHFERLNLYIHPLSANSKTVVQRFDSGKVDVLGVAFVNDQFLIKQKKLNGFKKETIKPLCWKQSLDRYRGTDRERVNKLIDHLNYQIQGWGGAYSFCDVPEEFDKMDRAIRMNLTTLLRKLNFNDLLISQALSGVKRLANLTHKPIPRT